MTSYDHLLPPVVREVLEDAKRMDALNSINRTIRTSSKMFDQLSAVAASAFEAPVAQVTFLDNKTQTIPSSLGFDIQESPVNTSFCAHALLCQESPMIVLDTTADSRFSENPFVRDQPHVRFYAGYPIKHNNKNVGTICVYDFHPRTHITREQHECLVDLTVQAVEMINLEMSNNPE